MSSPNLPGVSIRDAGGPGLGAVPGRLYRIAGVLVDDADLEIIKALQLRTIIDLRGANEDRSALETFAARQGIAYHHVPVQILTLADLAASAATEETARAYIQNVYIRLVAEFGSAWGRAISAIDGEFPVGFGCAAGKDRTGLLSALLQRMLGVEIDTVVAEYQRNAPDPAWIEERLRKMLEGSEPGPGLRYVSGTSPEALLAALGWVEERYASIEDYLVAMGAPAGIGDRLRARLTEA